MLVHELIQATITFEIRKIVEWFLHIFVHKGLYFSFVLTKVFNSVPNDQNYLLKQGNFRPFDSDSEC